MLLLEDAPTAGRLLDALIDAAERLGMFPEIAARVRDVARDPEASAQDLEEGIALDPALVARILRLANSPYYGGRRVVSTLRHALVVLGFRDAAQLALALAMAARDFERDLSRQVMRHGLQCAVIARELARHTRALDPAEAFVAGMLHDLGLLVMLEVYGDPYEAVVTDPTLRGEALLAAERAGFGTDHAQVGEACLDRWRFAKSTALAVRHHHVPIEMAGLAGRPAFCGDALIYLADWIDEERRAGVPRSELLRQLPNHEANRALDIPRERFGTALDHIDQELAALL
jgi:HD-like signal output (HDOD) protein